MPSFGKDKRSTSPKERIIPIELEGKSKNRYDPIHPQHSDSKAKKKSVIEIRRDDKNQDKWEVKVEEPKQTKPKESKKDSKEAKKESQKDSKKEVIKDQQKSDSKKDSKKDAKDTKKESKKDSKKKDKSKEEVDENRNVIDKSTSGKKKKKDEKEEDESKHGDKEKHSDHEVTITTQPGKSILKQPIASTPLPDISHDSDAWLNRSTASTGTVVKKKTSAGSKCCSWLCMPCGLCCACAPFECECCDCCYLKCTRCGEQCLCQCCNRKCC